MIKGRNGAHMRLKRIGIYYRIWRIELHDMIPKKGKKNTLSR